MAKCTLNIQIDPEGLQTLKDSKYNLCIARKVNGMHNVIWSGNTQYLANNKFSWVDGYEAGAPIKTSTNLHGIESGHTCEVNEAGIVSGAIGSTNNSGKFKVINKLGKLSFGVNTKLGVVGRCKHGRTSLLFLIFNYH
ncbi:hypothetical protein BDQ12DRAFT_671077 [Crucibulum laeve]|uniref:Uncharacterized protein n=1 Tax=Crucibulum laeve TaxID=68775 RepID=A0A5C3LHT6_9AGAR|nr:hypothetical protein BDQ12DRAFT_671077 [Crucibulum laeve]